MNDKPKTGAVIPFGKHKGTPVEVLQETDPQYLEWLSQQQWFRERWGSVYQVIINHGNEPSETPEHNALQLKWLELDFKRAAWMLVTRNEWCPDQIHQEFEQDAIDVLLAADHDHVAIELKPVMGDDYPAVVRQVRGYRNIKRRSYTRLAVVVGSFQSKVATLDQVRSLFRDITFLTVDEIDAHRVMVPLGIQNRIWLAALERHSALCEALHQLDRDKDLGRCTFSVGLCEEDEKAIREGLATLGEAPGWSQRDATKEWVTNRREMLERAVAEQTVLAKAALDRETAKREDIRAAL